MMKEKTTIPKRVKGTVLFTVVSVMMVLLVFLTATLALAVTANNRAMNNYSTVQTQQTAKAAVNAIMSAMQNDTQLARGAAMVSSDAPSIPIKDISFSYMEDVEQEDGTTVRAETASSSLGKVTNASIDYVGTKWILNEDNVLEEKTVIKITATAEQGTAASTCTAYVLRDVKPNNNEEGENMGFVATGSGVNGNHSSVYGGSYFGFSKDALLPSAEKPFTTYTAQNAATTFESDFQINGDLNTDTASDFNLVIKKPGTGMTVWGDLNLNHELYISSVNAVSSLFDSSNPLKYKDIPYIYVEGDINLNNSNQVIGPKTMGTLGGQEIPLNIFCNSIRNNYGGSHKTNIMADVYCYGTGTSVLTGTNPGNLYKWTASVVELGGSTENHVGGSFYTLGSLEVGGKFTFGGDVYTAQDLKVSGEVTIYGDVYVGGTVNIESGAKLNIYGGTLHYNGDSKLALSGTLNTYDMRGAQYVAGYSEIDSNYTKVTEKARAVPKTPVNAWDTPWKWVRGDGADLPDWIGNIATVTDNPDGTQTIINLWGGIIDPPNYSVWVDAAGNKVYDVSTITTNIEEYFVFNGTQMTRAEFEALAATHHVDKDNSYNGASRFPDEYKKDVILGNTKPNGDSTAELQPDGTTKINKDYKIISTVKEVVNSTNGPYETKYAVPSGTTYETDCTNNVFTLGNEYNIANLISTTGNPKRYTIEGSCTLKVNGSWGGPSDGTGVVIKAPAAGSEIWVVLDGTGLASDKNFLTGGYLVIDDTEASGTVNILIKGHVGLGGSSSAGTVGSGANAVNMPSSYQYFCTASIAKQLNDSSGTYQIYTQDDLAFRHQEEVEQPDGTKKTQWVLDYPKISAPCLNIYADKNDPSLTLGNNHVLTANMKAPYLDLSYSSMGGALPACTLYYNKFDIKSLPDTQVGCIGCCIVNDFYAQNNWELLYVSDSGAEDPPIVFDDALMTGWGILYYENY